MLPKATALPLCSFTDILWNRYVVSLVIVVIIIIIIIIIIYFFILFVAPASTKPAG